MASNNAGATVGGGAIYVLGIFGTWVYFWQAGGPGPALPGAAGAGTRDGVAAAPRFVLLAHHEVTQAGFCVGVAA